MAENIFLGYKDFLDDEINVNVYNRKVQRMNIENGRRIIIDIDDVRKYNLIRAKQLIVNYTDEEVELKRALKECVRSIDSDYANTFDEFFVGFCGSFGRQHVTPRTLKSKFLGSLVCLDGIVTRCSEVQSVLVKSVHYCPATKKMYERKHSDFTSPSYSFDLSLSNL